MMSAETNTWTFAAMLEGSEGGIMCFAKSQGENPPFAFDQCSSLILYTEDSSQTLQHLVKVRCFYLTHNSKTQIQSWHRSPESGSVSGPAKHPLSKIGPEIWSVAPAMRALKYRHGYGGK